MNSAARKTRPAEVAGLTGDALRKAKVDIEALRPGDFWMADRPITVEEFQVLTPEDTLAELFEGVIYVPNPDLGHERVQAFLFSILYGFVNERDLGEVLGSRSGVRLDDYSAPQPDVLFVPKNRRQSIHRFEIVEPPDLVIEIVHSDSSRYRAQAKLLRYEQFGVPEFWYVDVPRKIARLLHLNKDGRYQPTFEGKTGTLVSTVVPGFRIRARWLWLPPDQRPKHLHIIQELLAGRLPR